MVSADGNLALVFNGEIYNYLEVADELESLGWQLRPCGDTAVLLAAFAHWGPACVHRLRGMWAFAIYDPSDPETNTFARSLRHQAAVLRAIR